MEIYVVKVGDTIYSIAQDHGVSAERIISDNGITNPYNLVSGQALLILYPKTVHIVRPTENIYSIAQQYNTTPLAIIQNNPTLISQDTLYEGQNIVIDFDVTKRRTIGFSGFIYTNIRPYILESALPYVTYLIIFGYSFKLDGTMITVNDETIISLSHSYNAAVLLSFSLIEEDGSFNTSKKLDPLLNDMEYQNRVISGMIAEITKRNAQGMDIDMEYIPAEYRVEFAQFVANTSRQLHAAGYILNVDLAPKTSADQQGLLYESHDYRLLGEAADLAFLMTYEWGYTYGPPMAIAPINSVKAVLDYAITEIPKEKIYLGMPNYAYDWPLPYEKGVTAATTLGNVTAVERAAEFSTEILFDEYSQSPYFFFTNPIDSSEHVVWFEDARSMSAKYELIDSSGIEGGGYWNLMRPFPQGYMLLNNMFDIKKVYNNNL